MKKIVFILGIPLLITACNSDINRTVIIDKETKAVGKISKDTIFEGLIKFYDIVSNKLTSECYYLNGKENGEKIEYYKNGKISSISFYENGKENGEVKLYNEKGALTNKYAFYYGLRVGPSIEFTNSRIKKYLFYSFDGKILTNIDYDTLSNRSITSIQKDFFFFNRRNYGLIDSTELVQQHTEYFLYTPNPPGLSFKYSLVLTGPKYELKSELKDLYSELPWVVFDNEKINKQNNKLAIRLKVFDSTANRDITMFKILE